MIEAYDMPALRARLHVSKGTIYRWMSRPDPRKRLHRLDETSRVLVAAAELERWLRENTAN